MTRTKNTKLAIISFAFMLMMVPATTNVFGSAFDEVAPAPPSIGADIPLSYFGPAPSDVQKELIGPFQLLKSGQIDLDEGTITLPIYEGHYQNQNSKSIWYVLTDTTDAANAAALGLNHSPKLAYANVGDAARPAILEDDLSLTFKRGTVDFSPEHIVVPGEAPNAFPPIEFQPGSVGDQFYSPLVTIENSLGHVYNAPMIAFDISEEELNVYCDGNPDYSKVHDKVVRICPDEGTVTLELTPGFSFARPVLYLSLDATAELPASLEGATFAPALGDIPLGADDGAFSAVERLFAFINGPTGTDNPQRQGFNSALIDGRGPLNVLGGIPTIATDYSPLWDVNVGEWTQDALDNHYDSRLIEEFQILGMVDRGFVTGPGGSEYGSAGFIVNCPIVFRFL
jgi:hypothetical protein